MYYLESNIITMYQLIWDFKVPEGQLRVKDDTKVRTKNLSGTAFDGYSEAQLYSEFVNDTEGTFATLFDNGATDVTFTSGDAGSGYGLKNAVYSIPNPSYTLKTMTNQAFIDKLNTDLSTSITYDEVGDRNKVMDANYPVLSTDPAEHAVPNGSFDSNTTLDSNPSSTDFVAHSNDELVTSSDGVVAYCNDVQSNRLRWMVTYSGSGQSNINYKSSDSSTPVHPKDKSEHKFQGQNAIKEGQMRLDFGMDIEQAKKLKE